MSRVRWTFLATGLGGVIFLLQLCYVSQFKERRVELITLESQGRALDLLPSNDEQDNRTDFRIVWILAYPRTGSSLLGDILSVSPDATYLFEPIHAVRKSMMRDSHIAPLTNSVSRFVRGLFNCDSPSLDKVVRDKFILRKSRNVELCRNHSNSLLVVKTIRLTADHLRTVLERNDEIAEKIKVIHLTRDPRGIISSLRKLPKNWKPILSQENGTVICSDLERNVNGIADLVAKGLLHHQNLLEVQYEEYVRNYDIQIIRIYDFLGIELSQEKMEEISQHFQRQVGGYLSTYKDNLQVNINSWRSRLPEDMKRLIQERCPLLLTQEETLQKEVEADYQSESTSEESLKSTWQNWRLSSLAAASRFR